MNWNNHCKAIRLQLKRVAFKVLDTCIALFLSHIFPDCFRNRIRSVNRKKQQKSRTMWKISPTRNISSSVGVMENKTIMLRKQHSLQIRACLHLSIKIQADFNNLSVTQITVHGCMIVQWSWHFCFRVIKKKTKTGVPVEKYSRYSARRLLDDLLNLSLRTTAKCDSERNTFSGEDRWLGAFHP